MEGIQFVTNDQGEKVAVLIDLARQGESAVRNREKTANTKRNAPCVVTNSPLAA
jgi:hypothetical protein